MKINTKFNRGDLVITPLTDRPGKIDGIEAYGDRYYKYLVIIEWPMRTENKFKSTECKFDEEDLRKVSP